LDQAVSEISEPPFNLDDSALASLAQRFRPEALATREEPSAVSEASFPSRALSAAGASTVDSPKSTAASADDSPSNIAESALSSNQVRHQTQDPPALPVIMGSPLNRASSNAPRPSQVKKSWRKSDPNLARWLPQPTPPPPPTGTLPPAQMRRQTLPAKALPAQPALAQAPSEAPAPPSDDDDVHHLFEGVALSMRRASSIAAAQRENTGNESDASSDQLLMIHKKVDESLRQADTFHRTDSVKSTKPSISRERAAELWQTSARQLLPSRSRH